MAAAKPQSSCFSIDAFMRQSALPETVLLPHMHLSVNRLRGIFNGEKKKKNSINIMKTFLRLGSLVSSLCSLYMNGDTEIFLPSSCFHPQIVSTATPTVKYIYCRLSNTFHTTLINDHYLTMIYINSNWYSSEIHYSLWYLRSY